MMWVPTTVCHDLLIHSTVCRHIWVEPIYAQALKAAASGKGGASAAKIRQNERLWLAYLTDWLTFAKRKYPNVSADSWRVWLTRDRTGQLRTIADLP